MDEEITSDENVGVNKLTAEVIRILSSSGISWNDVSSHERKLLLDKVAPAVFARMERHNKRIDEDRKDKITREQIADEIGVTRKTLGSNNKAVSAFFDYFKAEQLSGDILISKQRKIDELTERLHAVINNDVDRLIVWQHEEDTLQQNEELNTLVNNLQQENANLRKKLGVGKTVLTESEPDKISEKTTTDKPAIIIAGHKKNNDISS